MNRVRVERWEDGAAFVVKAHPGSRREGFAGVHDGMLKVEVSAAPEKGKANKAIQKLLAKSLHLPASDLVLLSGDTQQKKRFGVRGASPEELIERIAGLGGNAEK